VSLIGSKEDVHVEEMPALRAEWASSEVAKWLPMAKREDSNLWD
jgi:hypothetical protein